MHRTKKMTVMTTGVALLMAAGMSSAMATSNNDNEHNDQERVTICHRTGPRDAPRYHEITVSKNALPAHQRHGDIYPVPANGCPKPDDGDDDNGDDGDHNGGNCIAESSSGDSNNDQHGFINVGSPTVHLDNALAGLLCQANTANNPAVTIIGDAVGISSFGGGLLGGSGGILSGALMPSAEVLAKVVVLF